MSPERIWKSLTDSYRERGLVLALGAGVSKDCKVPMWFDLLQNLFVHYFKNNGKTIFKRLVADGYTLPAMASILEHQFGSPEKFSEKIREMLYEKFDYYPEGITDLNCQQFIQLVSKNLTLSAVAALCVVPTDELGQWYRPNPDIRAIVTTNWDAILQAYTKVRYPTGVEKPNEPYNILRTIERPSAGMKRERISIYHIHGYLRFGGKADFGNPEKESPDLRVFTEQEFFNVFNQPNSLFNYTFLSLLREHSFLFIGMSLKDDNIRRLLHYSKMERELSYLKERRKEKKALARSIRHFAILPKSSPRINQLTESSLKLLGTRVLWVKNPARDVSRLLGKLYESNNKGGWKKVFKPIQST